MRERKREREKDYPIYNTQEVKKKGTFLFNTAETQVRVAFRAEENREP